MFRPARMRFGIFLAPFHRFYDNPTLSLERDLRLIEMLDEKCRGLSRHGRASVYEVRRFWRSSALNPDTTIDLSRARAPDAI